MRVCTIIFAFLVASVTSLAAENGPLLTALQPRNDVDVREIAVFEPQNRQKRFIGALGLGALGIGAAGLVGAGLIGAKAGLIGGALVGGALARSHGGYYSPSYSYGYGGGYGGGYGYGGYGYGGGYGGYRTYIVSDTWC